jgi:hypothetical protein
MAGEIYTYPNDLKIHGRALCISPIGITFQDRFTVSTKNRQAFIYLPIPHGLRTAYSARWGQEELGLIAGQAMKQIRAGNLDLAALSGSAGASIIKKLGGMASGFLSGSGTEFNVNNLASYAARGVINPNYALIFSGTNFRVFNFSYRLVARNIDESNEIENIVDTLKFYMSPSDKAVADGELMSTFKKGLGDLAVKIIGEGKDGDTRKTVDNEVDEFATNYMQYPNLFRLDFITERFTNVVSGDNELVINHDRNRYLFQPGNCALQTLDVNYGTEGTPAFFKETGAPVTVSIELTFIENEIVTKESIRSRMGPS